MTPWTRYLLIWQLNQWLESFNPKTSVESSQLSVYVLKAVQNHWGSGSVGRWLYHIQCANKASRICINCSCAYITFFIDLYHFLNWHGGKYSSKTNRLSDQGNKKEEKSRRTMVQSSYGSCFSCHLRKAPIGWSYCGTQRCPGILLSAECYFALWA